MDTILTYSYYDGRSLVFYLLEQGVGLVCFYIHILYTRLILQQQIGAVAGEAINRALFSSFISF